MTRTPAAAFSAQSSLVGRNRLHFSSSRSIASAASAPAVGWAVEHEHGDVGAHRAELRRRHGRSSFVRSSLNGNDRLPCIFVRVAAMDLGTNSFHLLVADVHADGHLDPLVREKEMLRLGDVVSRHGYIPPAAADQAVATIRRFRMLADAVDASETLAKATSAIRRAANGAELVDRIREETGVVVDVISGHEEARLIFSAIRASVVLDPAPAVCFDLGGGSLEIMVGDARGMQWATSLPLGVARLTAELVHSRSALEARTAGPCTIGSWRSSRRHAIESTPSDRSSPSGAAARSNASHRWWRHGATRSARRR